MKKSILGLVLALPFSVASAYDSIYAHEVIVTATRFSQPMASTLADVSIIDREEIERAGQSTLIELLRTLPGVEIESSGGYGQLSGVHMRGNGSQAVVVLIDGVRVGSSTTGTTAFEQMMPEQIDHIEVLRGPASSLYGADAIGGVIQIFTRQGEPGKPRIYASVGYGSLDTRQISGGISGVVENTRYAFNLSHLDSNGISALDTPSRPSSDHDDYLNTTVSASLFHQWSASHELGLQLYNSFNRVDFDDDFLFPARQRMIQRSFTLSSTDRFFPNWESRIQFGEGQDIQSSVGSSFGEDANSTYQRQYSWLNNFILPMGVLTVGYDRREEHVEAKTRFTRTHRENDGWLVGYLIDQGVHSAQASLRWDDNSQFGSHQTGSVSYGYRINPLWRVSGSYGTAYRAPTFNDLYIPFTDYSYVDPLFGPIHYTYQGNPDLKPETSRNRELSLVFDQGHHRFSATAFHNRIDNLIVAAQGLPDDFPANIGSATIKGLSLTYEGWIRNVHLRANADVLDPRNDDSDKQLVRRARRHASMWVGQTWDKLELGTEVIASGQRFNDAANDIRLAGYALVNLTASYRLQQDWSLDARVNNLFDRDYALSTTANIFSPAAPDYANPGTSVFVTLRWQPK